MSFLRIGVACVVINDIGQVLLSKRGDLGIWNLPGGRLDHNEYLWEAAAREVCEETGVEIEIEQPVGLYYITRWQRLDIIFRASATSDVKYDKTPETIDNRWFLRNDLPRNLLRPFIIADAFSNQSVLRVIETKPDEYRRLKCKFAWRWIKNLLSGHPEPRYPRFAVRAVGIIRNEDQSGIMTIESMLPFVWCDGQAAPWIQLSCLVHRYLNQELYFKWEGIWQNPANKSIDFLFTASVQSVHLSDPSLLQDRDAIYVEQVLDTKTMRLLHHH